MAPSLSIIIPTLNEADTIGLQLKRLAYLRSRGVEIILVDGASSDQTVDAASNHVDQVVIAQRGRASQMNAGAELAKGAALLFLHADTALPVDVDILISSALARSSREWGRFDVRIAPGSPVLAIVAFMMNWRSRITGVATGDQAIFVRRTTFVKIGGFPDVSLMEDIEICKALRRVSPPVCLHHKVTTSARRWQKYGVWRTIWLMWSLRLAHFRGVHPDELARRYGYTLTKR